MSLQSCRPAGMFSSGIGLASLAGFVLLIPISNWVVMNVGVSCVPDGPCVIPVWPGLDAPSAVLLAGIGFALRDAVHHFLGLKWAAAAIIIGAVISGFISEVSLVAASCLAFLFSEMADLLVYEPMRHRFPAWSVVVSGLAGSAVDSAIFLWLAFGSLDYVFGQVLGKSWMNLLCGALVGLWGCMKRHHAGIAA